MFAEHNFPIDPVPGFDQQLVHDQAGRHCFDHPKSRCYMFISFHSPHYNINQFLACYLTIPPILQLHLWVFQTLGLRYILFSSQQQDLLSRSFAAEAFSAFLMATAVSNAPPLWPGD